MANYEECNRILEEQNAKKDIIKESIKSECKEKFNELIERMDYPEMRMTLLAINNFKQIKSHIVFMRELSKIDLFDFSDFPAKNEPMRF